RSLWIVQHLRIEHDAQLPQQFVESGVTVSQTGKLHRVLIDVRQNRLLTIDNDFTQRLHSADLVPEKLDQFVGVSEGTRVDNHSSQSLPYSTYMKLHLDYGTTGLLAEFPEERTTVIEPVHIPPAPDPGALLQKAIREPIGKPSLRDLYRQGQKVAI